MIRVVAPRMVYYLLTIFLLSLTFLLNSVHRQIKSSRVCTLGGKPYSEGAVVVQEKGMIRCHNRTWEAFD